MSDQGQSGIVLHLTRWCRENPVVAGALIIIALSALTLCVAAFCAATNADTIK